MNTRSDSYNQGMFPFSTREIWFFTAVVVAFFVWDLAIIWFANWTLSELMYNFSGSIPFLLVIVFEALVLGTIFAQITVLAIWAIYAAGGTVLRVLLATLAIAGGSKLLGVMTQIFWTWSYPANVISYTAGWLFLLALFFAIQIPLHLLSKGLGWRILSAEKVHLAEVSNTQISVGAILGYTAFTAGLIFFARISFECAGSDGVRSLVALSIGCVLYAVVFLRMLNDRPLVELLRRLLVLVPLLTVVCVVGYHFAIAWWVWNLEVVLGVLAVQAFALFVGLVTLLAARRFGLRLVTNRLLMLNKADVVISEAAS